MAINEQEMKTLLELSKLNIDDSSLEEFKQDLTNILGLLDQLQQVDTTGVEALTNPRDDMQRLREDKVTETNQREELQKNAPASEAGLYLVPKVVE